MAANLRVGKILPDPRVVHPSLDISELAELAAMALVPADLTSADRTD
jgi:hypothetical protein